MSACHNSPHDHPISARTIEKPETPPRAKAAIGQQDHVKIHRDERGHIRSEGFFIVPQAAFSLRCSYRFPVDGQDPTLGSHVHPHRFETANLGFGIGLIQGQQICRAFLMTVSIRSRHATFISTPALPLKRSTRFSACLALAVGAIAPRWPMAVIPKNLFRMNAEVKAVIVFRWGRCHFSWVSKYSTKKLSLDHKGLPL